MVATSSLNFPPVLHNITPDKVVFCYRLGDADSLEVATHYCNVRLVPQENIIGLPCSDDNVITEFEYLDTIEGPLTVAIRKLGNFTSSGLNEIWVIILGYNIPHIYLPDTDPYDPYGPNPLAIASRLHRLGKKVELKRPQHVFDRRGNFKFFDALDSQELYITAVIDAPTKDGAINLINRAIDVDNQPFVTGKMLVDPFGKKLTESQVQYEIDMAEFIDKQAELVGLEVDETVDVDDPYIDPTVRILEGESFYWGWFEPQFAKELIKKQNQRRVFLYNADDTGASDIARDLDTQNSNPWVNLAINVESGYAATAGAVAPPGEDSYLRPRPFIESLHRGSTIGEAFLFSSRHVDWKLVFIGDPLLVVLFPVDLPPDQKFDHAVRIEDFVLPNDEVILITKQNIEEGLAYADRQSQLTQLLLDTNLSSINVAEEIRLLYTLAKWRDHKNQESQINLYSRAINEFLTYILTTTGLTFEQWLDRENHKITILFHQAINATASAEIEDSFDFEEGFWQYDFIYIHEPLTLENIHFDLQLSTTPNFSNVVIDVSSFSSIVGWKFESEKFEFQQMLSSGFPSNFSGRRIRFVSPEEHFLTRGNLFHVRWRALNSDGVPLTNYNVDPKVFIIKT